MVRCQISPVNGVFSDVAISVPADVGCWRRYWRSSANETVTRVSWRPQKCDSGLCQQARPVAAPVGHRLQALARTYDSKCAAASRKLMLNTFETHQRSTQQWKNHPRISAR